MGSIEQVVYGFVAMSVSAYCVDLVIEGRKQSVQIFIFTEMFDKIKMSLFRTTTKVSPNFKQKMVSRKRI